MSLDETAICVVDAAGKVLAESKASSTPDAIAAFIKERAPEVARVGLKAGSPSVWLHGDLRAHGVPVICSDARHAKAALSMRINKTEIDDRSRSKKASSVGAYFGLTPRRE